MIRRKLLNLFISTLSVGILSVNSVRVSRAQEDSWGKDLIEFNNLFCKYFKKYWGCEPLETDPLRCKGAELGARDYKLEEEMIRAWDKLLGRKG